MSLIEARVSQRPMKRAAVAAWSEQLGSPAPESDRSRLLARVGGLTAITGLLMYLTWRVIFTFPAGGAT